MGAALQLQQPVLWADAIYAALLGACLAGLWVLVRALRSGARWPGTVFLLAGLACGMAAGAGTAGMRACAYVRDAMDPALEGRNLEVTGVVAQMPQRQEGVVRWRFTVESAREITQGGGAAAVRLPRQIALAWYARSSFGAPEPASGPAPAPLHAPAPAPARADTLAVHAGERWRLTVRLKAPHGTLNPWGFDSEQMQWERGIGATGYVRNGAHDAPPERLGRTWRHPVERARESVRDAIFERVADPRRAGVIAGVVAGDEAAIANDDWDVFRTTGTAHLVSISGLHITLFGWLATALVGALWRRSSAAMLHVPAPHAARIGGMLLATGYAVFSGWGVPAQRTVCMFVAIALLRLAGLRWPWPFVWLLACAVVVAFDPWALMQAGFWLSFVAVGVLFATDGGREPARARTRIPRIARMLREQATVTLALAPLTLLLFHQVSLVALLANLAAIPWVTLVVTPLGMAGVVVPPLWQAADLAVGALMALLRALAAWPGASLWLPAPPFWAAVCGLAGALLLGMRLPWRLRGQGLVLLLPVLLWQAPRPPPGVFDLLAADVGQGDAVLVRTAHHSLLYDAGPRYGPGSDAGARVLVPLLRALGERLDLVLLSHRDTDHIGGAHAVLAVQPQAGLLSSIEATHPLRAEAIPSGRCHAGQQWDWDGVHFEILHPLAQDYDNPRAATNAMSCVLRIRAGRPADATDATDAAAAAGAATAEAVSAGAALLPGDIERPQEAALVARSPPGALAAQLLLAPHHGSKSSSSDGFLDAVAPRMVWAQAGYRNRFGHPAPAVLQRYAAHGISAIDTPHCGAIGWRSDRPLQWTCQRQLARRYWQHQVP
ncbi:MAG: DNA internalization-related competence protein ComEC/Rec2 [Burkholderiaceae bacterium]|nr:DNA internalization-related competence protein ComEC/Rec2 [Burkholderiaceae bacterium]